MYLRSLHIQNLKRIRDLELSFVQPNGEVRPLTVLIGPNGTAKTSILQAIALTAIDSRFADTLADQQMGVLRDRRRQETLNIQAVFARRSAANARGEPVITAKVKLAAGERGLFHHRMGPVRLSDRLVWHAEEPALVAAYGVTRALPHIGEAVQLDRPELDRLRNLFTPNARPTSLRFADYFDNAKTFASVLNQALKTAGLAPDLHSIELRGRGGIRGAGDLIERERFRMKTDAGDLRIPALAMSHGYQATVTWVADLIGHAMLDNPRLRNTSEIRGLVLIDELDAFLHPAWQRGLLGGIRKAFPNVQFVVSTHSPILISDVPPEWVVRLQLNAETGDVERVVHDAETGELRPARGPHDAGASPDPRLLTPSALLRDWFGLENVSRGVGQLGRDLYALRELEAQTTKSRTTSARQRTLQKGLTEAGILPKTKEPNDA